MANRGNRNWWIFGSAVGLAVFFVVVLIFRSDEAKTTTTTVLLFVGVAGCVVAAVWELFAPSGAAGGAAVGAPHAGVRADDDDNGNGGGGFWGKIVGSKVLQTAVITAISGIIGAAGTVAAAAINHHKPRKSITCAELRASVRAHHDTKPYPPRSAAQKKCSINKTIAQNRSHHTGKK